RAVGFWMQNVAMHRQLLRKSSVNSVREHPNTHYRTSSGRTMIRLVSLGSRQWISRHHGSPLLEQFALEVWVVDQKAALAILLAVVDLGSPEHLDLPLEDDDLEPAGLERIVRR